MEQCRDHGCEYSEESVLRMKMSKLHLAMKGGGGEGGAGTSGNNGAVHIGANGIVMVARHAPCWPPGMHEE